MGMYDCVSVPCPKCGEISEFQSKGGYCSLNSYTLEDVPDDVLSDINRHSPYICDNCETKFSVKVTKNVISNTKQDSKYVCTSVRTIEVITNESDNSDMEREE